jgi:hypothetical protein
MDELVISRGDTVGTVPFVSFITRCYKRPRYLEVNRAAIRQQTDQDYEHILLIDHTGRGVDWANTQFDRYKDYVQGCWVYMIDDDDFLATPHFIADIRRIATQNNPDIMMCRVDHGRLGVLPPNDIWGYKPQSGRIGTSSVIVKAEIWKRHIHTFTTAYDGDYCFIRTLFEMGYRIHWHDAVVAKIHRQSRGKPE